MKKPIDENGKLFGKINIIDFLILLFLLCNLPLFYFGYELYRQIQKATIRKVMNIENPEIFTLKVPCLFKSDLKTLKKIKVGDMEKNEKENTLCKVEKIGRLKILKQFKTFGTPGHEYIFPLANDLIYKTETLLELKVFIHNRFAFYKNLKNLVEPGSLIEISTDTYTLMCTVQQSSTLN